MTWRVDDWRPKLVTWAENTRGIPFIWGRSDCATMVRNALSLCFGRDVAPNIPFWRNKKQAAQLVAEWGNVQSIIERLGGEWKTLPFARGGDVIVLPEAEEDVTGTALGIWIDRFAVMSSRDGVVWVARDELERLNPRLLSLWAIPDIGAGPYG